jgi:hypothetical protein
MRLAFDIRHAGRSPQDNVTCTMVGSLWPWTLTSRSNYCFFNDKFVSGLQLVCLTRYAVDIRHVCRSPQDDVLHAMVGDFWPWIWPQIIIFLMTSSCPGCNFFVYLYSRYSTMNPFYFFLKTDIRNSLCLNHSKKKCFI